MMKSDVRDLLQDIKIVSTQEISGNSGILGSSGKKTAGRSGVLGREPGMFLCDRTQQLEWPDCTDADANQLLKAQTGKASQTGFKAGR